MRIGGPYSCPGPIGCAGLPRDLSTGHSLVMFATSNLPPSNKHAIFANLFLHCTVLALFIAERASLCLISQLANTPASSSTSGFGIYKR